MTDPALVAAHVVRRLRRPDGELRANVLRIVAVCGFYAVHLVNVVFLDLPPGPSLSLGPLRIGLFDVGATLAAGAEAAAAATVLLTARAPGRPWIGRASTAVDGVLLTALVALAGGFGTPLLFLWPLVVVGAGLRGERGHVALTTLGALASCLATWVGTRALARAAPSATDLLVVCTAIGGVGLVTGQLLETADRALDQHADALVRLWTRGAGATVPTGPVDLVVPAPDGTCPWCGVAAADGAERCGACDQPLRAGLPFHTWDERPAAVFRPAWFVAALGIGGTFTLVALWLVVRLPAGLPPLLLLGGLVGTALFRAVQEDVRTGRDDAGLAPLAATLGPAAGTVLVGLGLVGAAVVVAYFVVFVAVILLGLVCVVMLMGSGGRLP